MLPPSMAEAPQAMAQVQAVRYVEASFCLSTTPPFIGTCLFSTNCQRRLMFVLSLPLSLDVPSQVDPFQVALICQLARSQEDLIGRRAGQRIREAV